MSGEIIKDRDLEAAAWYVAQINSQKDGVKGGSSVNIHSNDEELGLLIVEADNLINETRRNAILERIRRKIN